ncbi:MAG: hypothetical protein ACLGIA_06730 [Actinomycetes bacterium]
MRPAPTPSGSRRSRRPRAVLAALALALVAVLAACSEPAPKPHPQKAADQAPVVVRTQLDRIVQEVAQALAAADQARNPEALPGRADGAELQIRQARYPVTALDPAQPLPPPLGTERLVDVVPVDNPVEAHWPRFVLTVAKPTPDAAVPRISVLTEASAHDPYKISASATVAPGVTLPRTAPSETGVEPLPADQPSGLAATPADAVAWYASVLTSGPESPHAQSFAEDKFAAAVLGESNAERTAASVTCPGCFSYYVNHAPREGAIWSVRTEDGGAMVMSVLDSTRTFAVATPGAKLPIPGDLSLLAGRNEASQSAEIKSVEVVVLEVPKAGSQTPLRLLAADRTPVAVTAS